MFDVVIILSAQLAGRDVEKPPKRRSAAISARMLQPPSANVTGWGAASGGGANLEAIARRAALQAAQRVRFDRPLYGINWMFCMTYLRRGARRCRPPSGCMYAPPTLYRNSQASGCLVSWDLWSEPPTAAGPFASSPHMRKRWLNPFLLPPDRQACWSCRRFMLRVSWLSRCAGRGSEEAAGAGSPHGRRRCLEAGAAGRR